MFAEADDPINSPAATQSRKKGLIYDRTAENIEEIPSYEKTES